MFMLWAKNKQVSLLLLLSQYLLHSRDGMGALDEGLVLAEKLHPGARMVAPDVLERGAAPPVLHNEELRTVSDEELDEVGVGLARPARVVERSAAGVVTNAGGDVGLRGEVVNDAGEAPAAGHVEEGFAESVGRLESKAFCVVKRAEGVEVLSAYGSDGLDAVRFVVRIGVLEKVVLERKGGYRGDGRVLRLEEGHEISLWASTTSASVGVGGGRVVLGVIYWCWRGILRHILNGHDAGNGRSNDANFWRRRRRMCR